MLAGVTVGWKLLRVRERLAVYQALPATGKVLELVRPAATAAGDPDKPVSGGGRRAA